MGGCRDVGKWTECLSQAVTLSWSAKPVEARAPPPRCSDVAPPLPPPPTPYTQPQLDFSPSSRSYRAALSQDHLPPTLQLPDISHPP